MREELEGTTENGLNGNRLEAWLRSHDWSKTPLGAIETWTDDLKVTAQIILTELERVKQIENASPNGHLPQDSSPTATLHQVDQLNAFRVRLTEALRSLVDASEIQATAARILGEALAATRVLYIEVTPDGREADPPKNTCQ